METTERIVEAYVRYVKGWATIPNIKCRGQYEIDLLAINPAKPKERYHIETSVSIASGFSKLTAQPFDKELLKERGQAPIQRRTLGYFVERKFGDDHVLDKLKQYGFEKGRYTRVIVTWGWQKDVEPEARAEGIKLWDFRDIIQKIAEEIKGGRGYFADDTLRTLHLFERATRQSANQRKA